MVWLRRAFDLSRNISVLLILVHLPIALLFSLASRLLYEDPASLARDTALLTLLYVFAAVLAGSALTALSAVAALAGETARRRVVASGLLTVGVLALVSLLPMLDRWWTGTLTLLRRTAGVKVPPELGTWLLVVLGAVAVIGLFRRGLVATGERLGAALQNGATATIAIAAVAAVTTVGTGHFQWRAYGWSPTAPVASGTRPPHVILITIDTLARQDMSLYGYGLPTTPGLERIAQQAHVFDRFYANSNFTTPTITSILTGRYPISHGVYHLYGKVAAAERDQSLASELRRRGYATAAVMSNPFGHPLNVGLFEAFDFIPAIPNAIPGRAVQDVLAFHRANVLSPVWDWWWITVLQRVLPRIPLDAVQQAIWFPPEKVVEGSREFLAGAGDRPVFLWAHFLPPHDPYIAPPPYHGQFLPTQAFSTLRQQYVETRLHGPYGEAAQPAVDQLRLRYNENIAFVDAQVSSFLDELASRGVLDQSVLIITADHGESFERNWCGHNGPLLHAPLVQIPLIMRLPGQRQGSRIGANAEQVDLLPTVLDAIGAPIPAYAQGESLLPLLRGEAASGKPKFAMAFNHVSRFQPLHSGTVSVLQGDERMIRDLASGCEELYDLAADPSERVNRIADAGPGAAPLRASLDALLAGRLAPALAARPPSANCAARTPDRIR